MTKNVAVRYYDSQNLGDDLLVYIASNRYSDPFFVSPITKRKVFQEEENVKQAQGFALFFTYKVLRKFFRKTCMPQYGYNIDLLLYIGGSIFIEGKNPKKWRCEEKFYEGLTIPYYILDPNVGPYETSEFLNVVIRILAAAKDVCLRDNKSYSLVQNLPNTRVSTDVAFLLDTEPYKETGHEKRAIFSLIDGYRKFDSEIAGRYETEVRKMTIQLINRGYDITYMSFCKYEGDEVVNARIMASLPKEMQRRVNKFNYSGNIREALSLISTSELIIASRFHASVLGLVFGKKVLPMAYSDKTVDILTDIEFPGTVIDIRKMKDFDSQTVDFDSIPIMDASPLRELAEVQFQELDKILTRRS